MKNCNFSFLEMSVLHSLSSPYLHSTACPQPPPHHMSLKTISKSQSMVYPWFTPGRIRRKKRSSIDFDFFPTCRLVQRLIFSKQHAHTPLTSYQRLNHQKQQRHWNTDTTDLLPIYPCPDFPRAKFSRKKKVLHFFPFPTFSASHFLNSAFPHIHRPQVEKRRLDSKVSFFLPRVTPKHNW